MFKMHIFCPNNVILFPRFSDLYCILWGQGAQINECANTCGQILPKKPYSSLSYEYVSGNEPHAHLQLICILVLLKFMNTPTL